MESRDKTMEKEWNNKMFAIEKIARKAIEYENGKQEGMI